MSEITEEEKYRRKGRLLQRALAEADVLDLIDAEKKASVKTQDESREERRGESDF